MAWVGSSKRDLKAFPAEVQDGVGFALWLAQIGEKHPHAKVLKGFGDASVIEIIEDHDEDAYRAVYTVRFEEAVYVLHAFQKKSRRGAKTPKPDIELIEKRLGDAKARHEAQRKERK